MDGGSAHAFCATRGWDGSLVVSILLGSMKSPHTNQRTLFEQQFAFFWRGEQRALL